MCLQIPKTGTVNREVQGELFFTNTLSETLTRCTLTLSGSGLMLDERQLRCVRVRVCVRVCARVWACLT